MLQPLNAAKELPPVPVARQRAQHCLRLGASVFRPTAAVLLQEILTSLRDHALVAGELSQLPVITDLLRHAARPVQL